eukprot:scaffold710_cov171-Amphora_coffeaeformis.AAC.35
MNIIVVTLMPFLRRCHRKEIRKGQLRRSVSLPSSKPMDDNDGSIVVFSPVPSLLCSPISREPSADVKARVVEMMIYPAAIVMQLFVTGYVEAGTWYGAWGGMITGLGLVTGVLIDNLGVARSLQLGFLLTLVSRILIFWTSSRFILIMTICTTLPLGSCLGIPVLTIGIRRYTNEENRGFAFGLFYVVMNVAALLSGPIVDTCTIAYKNHAGENRKLVADEADYSWTLSGYRLVILSGIIANVAAVFVAWTVREIKIEAPVPVEEDQDTAAASPPLETSEKKVTAFVPVKGSTWVILKETCESSRFWRFLVVCLRGFPSSGVAFKKSILTVGTVLNSREFGSAVPKGTIYSINPALIIILVPLVTAATSGVDPLLMIHHGSYISSASVFFLAISTTISSSVIFVIVLSIGEAVWSPRLYDYTMSISKEGREGTYGALSSAPLFLAKLPVGFMGGYLLEKYCPEEGERRSKMMWFIIGMTTVSSPIFMSVFWKYISFKDPDEGVKYTELLQQDQLVSSSYKDDNEIDEEDG